MPFRFAWYDDEKTVMQLIAEGDWNWRDYHAAARASSFSMHQHPHPVSTLVDLRGSTRETLPAGLAAHTSSFGKKITPALNGYAVVLGMPREDWAALPLNEDGTLSTRDGRVYYAADEAEARAILDQLRQHDG